MTLLALGCAASMAAQAQSVEGTKTITLHTPDQQALRIASVTFSKPVDGDYAFTGQFLSMCEFKCVGGARELMCFVPYPCARGQTVSDVDFA